LIRLKANEAIASDPAGKDGAVAYGLDPVGNRLSAGSTLPGIASGTFVYNMDDLLSMETYDANGNTLTTGGRSFAYDSESRLKSMNGGAVALQYDGDGNRVAETAGGVTTRYLVDDLNPTGYAQVMDELVGGTVQREYIYGLQRISQDQLLSGTWTPSFYGYDGMGSVRQLTNLGGAVTDTYSYDGFGNLLSSTGTTPNIYLYRGEQFDPNLELYYLRARYYNPATGRFLSRDPESGKALDPKTLHKYLYAGGDPVNAKDPTGKDDLLEYSARAFDIYNNFIAPAMSGNDFAKCANEAFAFLTEDINAEIQGNPLPVNSSNIVEAIGNCEGKAIFHLIEGPWGLIF
jgi:RHS repeat-associated protein